jgi:phospholipid-binding lipoprotein MlaA
MLEPVRDADNPGVDTAPTGSANSDGRGQPGYDAQGQFLYRSPYNDLPPSNQPSQNPSTAAPVSGPAHEEVAEEAETDPLEPFNTRMFWFDRKLDEYALRPVAKGWAKVMPGTARAHLELAFENVDVLRRFANNLLQLRMPEAGGEVGRFAINSTLGVGGLFDVADHWFGMKEHYQDFGLTLGHYGVGMGPYLVLPFYGPSSIRDGVGIGVDAAMNPMNYLLPTLVSTVANTSERVAWQVNYESLNLGLFEDVDRYAVDLYGAVQDGYVQRRAKQLKQ